jgi:hypothetical protein
MSTKNSHNNNIKKNFNDVFNRFINQSIPLKEEDNIIYFMSQTNQLYGLDIKNQSIFEPNSSNKYKIINSSIKVYFNDEVKKMLENKVNVKFDELEELILKFNYREKNIGKKFYYSEKERQIFVWSLVNNKWELGDNDLVYLFKNSDIIKEISNNNSNNIIVKKTLDELGGKIEDMEEITKRFKDNSIHYYNKKDNKIYSLNILTGSWYNPNDNIQKQIIKHYNANNNLENNQ